MKEILFILLVVVSEGVFENPVLEYKHMIWGNGSGTINEEIIDEWRTTKNSGSVSTFAAAHYKAILFHTKEALERYLAKYKLSSDSILLDVKNSKQIYVSQEPIKEKVMKEEVRGYFFHFNEKKSEVGER